MKSQCFKGKWNIEYWNVFRSKDPNLLLVQSWTLLRYGQHRKNGINSTHIWCQHNVTETCFEAKIRIYYWFRALNTASLWPTPKHGIISSHISCQHNKWNVFRSKDPNLLLVHSLEHCFALANTETWHYFITYLVPT